MANLLIFYFHLKMAIPATIAATPIHFLHSNGCLSIPNRIDSRYRSGKPLIVTTNLTLDDLHNPEDTAHSRIYDRLLSMCVPVRFTGDNFRQETAKRKMESMKKLITD